MNIDQLQSTRQRLATQIRALAKNQPVWTDSDKQQWHSVNAEYDTNRAALDAEMERQRMNNTPLFGRDRASMGNALEIGPRNVEFFSGQKPGPSVVDGALSAWAKNAMGMAVSPADAEACNQFGLSINSNTFAASMPSRPPTPGLLLARNALQQTGKGSDGGFLIESGFVPMLEKSMVSYAGMLQAGQTMITENGADLHWPLANDSSNSGELLYEGVATNEDSIPFGRMTLFGHTYSSKVIRVSRELVEDSAISLPEVLAGLLGERIGRALNEGLTNGTSGNQPTGVTTVTTAGATAGSSSAIQFDDLIALAGSVDPSYRSSPSCGFMCHATVWNLIQRLKDGEGRYLWNSPAFGQPTTLLGYPLFLNQSMPKAISSGTKSVIFGDFSRYKIRLVGQVQIRRLVERYAEFNQEGFIGFLRADGGLLDAGSHPLKHLVH